MGPPPLLLGSAPSYIAISSSLLITANHVAGRRRFHTISYDDGDVQKADLSRERHLWIDPAPPLHPSPAPSGAPTAAPAAAAGAEPLAGPPSGGLVAAAGAAVPPQPAAAGPSNMVSSGSARGGEAAGGQPVVMKTQPGSGGAGTVARAQQDGTSGRAGQGAGHGSAAGSSRATVKTSDNAALYKRMGILLAPAKRGST